MPNTVITLTNLDDFPGALASFADTCGWTTTTVNTTSTTVVRPNGALTYTVSRYTGEPDTIGYLDGVKIVATYGGVTRTALTERPALGGAKNAPVKPEPTRVFFYGNAEFVAAVIEFGFNSYRHVYVGSIERFGSYQHGDVFSCNSFWPGNRSPYSTATGTNDASGANHQHLFGARYRRDYRDASKSGGAVIEHADNATPFRAFFDYPDPNEFKRLDPESIRGGHGDGLNDIQVGASAIPYGRALCLTPVNLVCPDSTLTGDGVRVRPVGHVRGVRMTTMQYHDPGTVLQVGSESWQVFPEFSKRSIFAPYGSDGYYSAFETSGDAALAYPLIA